MANTIRLRRGTTTPTAGSFVEGEPAWDSSGGKLYIKNAAGSMVLINSTGGGSGTYTVSATAPGSPSSGDRWLDTDTGVQYTYINDGNSSQWVELGTANSTLYSSLVLADYGLITEAVTTTADYGALV